MRASSPSSTGNALVELGDAAWLSQGLVVAGVRADSSGSEAMVVFWDGQHSHREIFLGEVYGSTELPTLAARGLSTFVAVSDNEASSAKMSLLRIDEAGAAAEISRGLELSVVRDDFTAARIGLPSQGERGFLIWDDFEQQRARSVVRLLPFSLSSLDAAGPPRVLSPSEKDATQPRIVTRPGGFYALWLSAQLAGAAASRSNLGAQIAVTMLSESGQAIAAPLLASEPHDHVFSYDAQLFSGQLLVAFRAADPQAGWAEGPLKLALVGADGSVSSAQVTGDRPGPGAPQLLCDAQERCLLAARGDDDQLLLCEVGPHLSCQLADEPALRQHVPLAYAGQRLRAMSPDRLDWRLAAFDCRSAARETSP